MKFRRWLASALMLNDFKVIKFLIHKFNLLYLININKKENMKKFARASLLVSALELISL